MAADPAFHDFAVSGAFVLGAIIGAAAVLKLVKHLTAYLKRNGDHDGERKDQ